MTENSVKKHQTRKIVVPINLTPPSPTPSLDTIRLPPTSLDTIRRLKGRFTLKLALFYVKTR